MNLTFDSLMVRALDEPDAVYGLAARSVAVSPDGLTYTFALRPQARFHDGSRLTARDAAFSLTLLREKGHPEIAEVIRAMTEAQAEGDGAAGRDLRARPRPGPAAVRGAAADLLGGLLRRPRLRGLDPGGAAGLRPLPGRHGRSRPLHRIRAGAGLLGRRPAGECRPEQLRHDPLRVFSRSHRGVRGVQERRLHVPGGVHRPGLGHGLRLPGARRGPRGPRDGAGCAAQRHAGLVDQHPPRRVPRSRGCARRSACASISNGRTGT